MTESDRRPVLSIPEHVLLQRVHTGEAVMLNLEDESYFGLNEVAARMVEVLSSSDTLDTAIESLLEEYDAEPAALRRDTEELLDTLHSRGLVDIA